MADDIDLAADAQSALIASGLARIDAAIAPGVAGDCDECGEWMQRLVGGRCAFCREGRERPVGWFDRHPVPTPEEKAVMTSKVTDKSRVISVPVKGALLGMIEQRAAELDLPLGQTVAGLCETAFAEPTEAPAAVAAQSAEWDGTREGAAIFFENCPDAWLIEELGRRLSGGASAADHAAAIARAEAAEAKLTALRAALAD